MNNTIERLHASMPTAQTFLPNSTGFGNSSMASPPSEAFHGGALIDHFKQHFDSYSPPAINSGTNSNKIIEYKQIAEEASQMKNLLVMVDQVLDGSPMTPSAPGESMAGTLEAGKVSPSFEDAYNDTFNKQLPPNLGVNLCEHPGRITPFQLENLSNSQHLANSSQHQNLIDKSVTEENASMSIGERARQNIMSKIKHTPSQQALPGENQSVFIALNETIKPQFEFEMPAVHAQVNLHRTRQRDNEEKLIASLKKSYSPKADFGGPSLSQNQELDFLWTPPELATLNDPNNLDLVEILKLQRPMQGINKSTRQSHGRLPEINSHSKSVKKMNLTGSQASLDSNKPHFLHKQSGMSVSLSKNILAVQGLTQGVISTKQGFSGGFAFPISPKATSPQRQIPPSQNLGVQPFVINIGTLSHFNNQQPTKSGYFPRRKSFGKNEKRFFKKSADHGTGINDIRSLRAQTASALGRATIRVQDQQADDEKRVLSLNSTHSGVRWVGQKQERPKSGSNLSGEGGTVVLSATIAGFNTTSHVHQTLEGPESPLNRQLSPDLRVQKLLLSSDLKIRGRDKANNNSKTTNSAIARDGQSGLVNQAPTDTSCLKSSQISPQKEQGDQTTTAYGRDLQSVMNQNANFTLSLQRRYEGSSFVNLNGPLSIVSFDERNGKKGGRARVLSGPIADRGLSDSRSNSGSLTKRRSQVVQYDHINRRNVLAKSKNMVIDITGEELNKSPYCQESQLDMKPVLPRDTSEISQGHTLQKEDSLQIGAQTLTHKQLMHSPLEQMHGEFIAPVIQLNKSKFAKPGTSKINNRTQQSQNAQAKTQSGSGVPEELTSKKGLKTSFSGGSGAHNLTQKTTQQGFRTQKHSTLQSAIPGNRTQYDNSQVHQSSDERIVGHAGLIQNKTDRSGLIQVDIQNNRYRAGQRTSNGRRNQIEFKILSLNLNQPSFADRSNMMTCELDLSQHLPKRFARRSLKSKDNFGTLLSQTLSLQSPQAVFSQNELLQGTSIHKDWKEINVVKLSIGGEHDTQKVVIPSIQVAPDHSRLQMTKMSKLQNNSSNAVGVNSVRTNQRMVSMAVQASFMSSEATSQRSGINIAATQRPGQSKESGFGELIKQALTNQSNSSLNGPNLSKPNLLPNILFETGTFKESEGKVPLIRSDYFLSGPIKAGPASSFIMPSSALYQKSQSFRKHYSSNGQNNDDIIKDFSSVQNTYPREINEQTFAPKFIVRENLMSSHQKRSSVLFKRTNEFQESNKQIRMSQPVHPLSLIEKSTSEAALTS